MRRSRCINSRRTEANSLGTAERIERHPPALLPRLVAKLFQGGEFGAIPANQYATSGPVPVIVVHDGIRTYVHRAKRVDAWRPAEVDDDVVDDARPVGNRIGLLGRAAGHAVKGGVKVSHQGGAKGDHFSAVP